jgi:hypothetical protein
MRINSVTMEMESVPFVMHGDILKYLGAGLSCTKPRVWETCAYCLPVRFLKKQALQL